VIQFILFRVNGYPMPEVEWFKDNLSIMKNPDYKTTFNEGAESFLSY